MPNVTSDTFFNGRITVKQPSDGYRYSIDPILLANFIIPQSGDYIIDLGTGCGIMPVILAHKHPGIKITGIEIQNRLFEIALNNIIDNNLGNQVTIYNSDIKRIDKIIKQKKYDHIISNPPYIKSGAGRINPDSQKAIARHEIKITLNELVNVASDLLKPTGTFSIIYPSNRLSDIFQEMEKARIEPKRIRFIHPRQHYDAKLVLVSAKKNGRSGLTTMPPIFIYEKEDEYTEEMKNLFRNT